MSHVAGKGIAVLVGQPLEFSSIRVSCTYVLALKMFQLAVDVVAFSHDV